MVDTKGGEAPSTFKIESERKVSTAQLWVARIGHPGPRDHSFCKSDVFWIDLCLTPRRPLARARYVDRWGPHRFAEMGSIIALPPGFELQLKHEGGAHASLICALEAKEVEKWLPPDFHWTDRRLEACLGLAAADIRSTLVRLSHEMRHPELGRQEVCEALVEVLAIDLARTLISMDEPTKLGGLATWRLRLIDKRLAEPGGLPTLAELAALCSMSARQLTRGFRTSRGTSVGEYISQYRIDTAKRRLETDETLKSIANATGFSSQSSFTLAFRRATGMTPRNFRQRIIRAMASKKDGDLKL